MGDTTSVAKIPHRVNLRKFLEKRKFTQGEVHEAYDHFELLYRIRYFCGRRLDVGGHEGRPASERRNGLDEFNRHEKSGYNVVYVGQPDNERAEFVYEGLR